MGTVGLDTILLVDDDPLVLLALETLLKRDGYTVVTAISGETALPILRNTQVALIISDQNMPGMKGSEFLRQSIDIQPDAIRITLTAVNDLNTLASLINTCKISQFIIKPWDNAILLQTVKSSIEKYRLAEENKRLNALIVKQHNELQISYEKIHQELQMGGHVQKVLLLGTVPTDIEGLDIFASSIPSQVVDGDFFGFYHPRKEFFDIAIGDVMGKGITAALVGTAVKSQLSRFANPVTGMEVFNKEKRWHGTLLSPVEIMSCVEAEVSQSLIDLGYFVSLIYGRFDLAKKIFTFIDLGSTKPFQYVAKTGEVIELRGENFPLGILRKDSFKSKEVSFDEEDVFVFYSDGVTEAHNTERKMFGMENIQTLILEHKNKSAEEIQEKIKEAVSVFSGSTQFQDDLTLLVIKMAKPFPNYGSEERVAKFRSDLSQLKAVRDFVESICKQVNTSSENFASLMQLAINEAFSNIIDHGYGKDPKHEIIIRGQVTQEKVIFKLEDKGKSFMPAQVGPPSFSGDRFSGFGLYMITQVADCVSYQPKLSQDGYNQLIIEKAYHHKENVMEISHLQEEKVLTITLHGNNLDAKEAPVFKDKVIDLIAKTNSSYVILDLHQLNFIDSSGLGSFLSLLRILNTRGGDLKMVGMTNQVRTIFELVCMHKIFEIYNTKEEAVHSFAG